MLRCYSLDCTTWEGLLAVGCLHLAYAQPSWWKCWIYRWSFNSCRASETTELRSFVGVSWIIICFTRGFRWNFFHYSQKYLLEQAWLICFTCGAMGKLPSPTIGKETLVLQRSTSNPHAPRKIFWDKILVLCCLFRKILLSLCAYHPLE